jgi:hypothetical protein
LAQSYGASSALRQGILGHADEDWVRIGEPEDLEAPWLDPCTCTTVNRPSRTTFSPRAANRHAAAVPMTPAPTMMVSTAAMPESILHYYRRVRGEGG